MVGVSSGGVSHIGRIYKGRIVAKRIGSHMSPVSNSTECLVDGFVYQIRGCRSSGVKEKRVSSQTLFRSGGDCPAHSRACKHTTCRRLPRRSAHGFSSSEPRPVCSSDEVTRGRNGSRCARSLSQTRHSLTGNAIRPTGPTPSRDNLQRDEAFEKHCEY